MKYVDRFKDLTRRIAAASIEVCKGIILLTLLCALPLLALTWGVLYILGIMLLGGFVFGEVAWLGFWDAVGIFIGVIGTTAAALSFVGSSAYD
ncbi:MAG: hypothetical protein ACK5PR_00855 [bacterium]|jgi:hypothetical protein